MVVCVDDSPMVADSSLSAICMVERRLRAQRVPYATTGVCLSLAFAFMLLAVLDTPGFRCRLS